MRYINQNDLTSHLDFHYHQNKENYEYRNKENMLDREEFLTIKVNFFLKKIINIKFQNNLIFKFF